MKAKVGGKISAKKSCSLKKFLLTGAPPLVASFKDFSFHVEGALI